MGPFLTKKKWHMDFFLARSCAAGRLPVRAYAVVRETCLFEKTADVANSCSKRQNFTNHTQVPARGPVAAVFPARKPLLTLFR